MKFLNTKDMLITQKEEFNTINYHLTVNHLLELKLNDFLDKLADIFVNVAEKIKEARIDNTQAYYINFTSDLEDLEDLKQIGALTGVMLIKSQIKKKRHKQLAFQNLEHLGDIALTEMTLVDILKNKSKIKFLNFGISTKENKLQFYMIGEVPTDEND